MRLPDEPQVPDEAHDERLPQPGDEVLVYFQDLNGVLAVVRSITDASQGIISVRIPFKNIPEKNRHLWVKDPLAPAFAPLVVQRGEYVLFKRAGFSAPFRHPGESQ